MLATHLLCSTMEGQCSAATLLASLPSRSCVQPALRCHPIQLPFCLRARPSPTLVKLVSTFRHGSAVGTLSVLIPRGQRGLSPKATQLRCHDQIIILGLVEAFRILHHPCPGQDSCLRIFKQAGVSSVTVFAQEVRKLLWVAGLKYGYWSRYISFLCQARGFASTSEEAQCEREVCFS